MTHPATRNAHYLNTFPEPHWRAWHNTRDAILARTDELAREGGLTWLAAHDLALDEHFGPNLGGA